MGTELPEAHLDSHRGPQHHRLLLDALSKLGGVVIDIQQQDSHLGEVMPASRVLCSYMEVVLGGGLGVQAGPGLCADDPRGGMDLKAARHKEQAGCAQDMPLHMCAHISHMWTHVDIHGHMDTHMDICACDHAAPLRLPIPAVSPREAGSLTMPPPTSN